MHYNLDFYQLTFGLGKFFSSFFSSNMNLIITSGAKRNEVLSECKRSARDGLGPHF